MNKKYGAISEAYAQTGRRNQALALGECVLKLQDLVRETNKRHPLKADTIRYTVGERKVIDPTGRKGFHYTVTMSAESYEPDDGEQTEPAKV